MAKRADVSKSDFEKIVAVGLPAILQALQRNSADKKGLASLEAALGKHQDVSKYSSINQVAEDVTRCGKTRVSVTGTRHFKIFSRS